MSYPNLSVNTDGRHARTGCLSGGAAHAQWLRAACGLSPVQVPSIAGWCGLGFMQISQSY